MLAPYFKKCKNLQNKGSDYCYSYFQNLINELEPSKCSIEQITFEGKKLSPQHFKDLFNAKWLQTLYLDPKFNYRKYLYHWMNQDKDLIRHALWNGRLFHQTEEALQLSIEWVNDSIGYGLFSQKEVPKQTFLGYYSGKLIQRNFFSFKNNLYTFSQFKPWHKLFFYGIDSLEMGNHTRFINHSVNSNCSVIPMIVNNLLLLGVVSSKTVPKGSQLLLNYGQAYWSRSESAPQPIA